MKILIRSQTWRCICLSVLKRLVLAVQGQAAKCRRRRNLSGAATKALRFTLAPHSNKCPWPVPQVQSNLENFGNTWVTGMLGNQEFQWLCVFKNFLGGPCVGKQEKMRGWPSWYLAVTDLGDGGRELRLGMVNKRTEEEGEHHERGDRVIDNFQIHALGFPPRPWASRWAHSLLEADAYCPGPIRQQWSHHKVICHLEIPGLCLLRCALVPPHWTWLSRVIYCTTCGLVGINNVEILVTSSHYTLSPPFSPGFKMFLFPPL